jgi:hypothetical protein
MVFAHEPPELSRAFAAAADQPHGAEFVDQRHDGFRDLVFEQKLVARREDHIDDRISDADDVVMFHALLRWRAALLPFISRAHGLRVVRRVGKRKDGGFSSAGCGCEFDCGGRNADRLRGSPAGGRGATAALSARALPLRVPSFPCRPP